MAIDEQRKRINKKYYDSNRDKILDCLKAIWICERCGEYISYTCMRRHQMRKTCQLKYEIKLLQNENDLKVS